jgi:hypothetical protein
MLGECGVELGAIGFVLVAVVDAPR